MLIFVTLLQALLMCAFVLQVQHPPPVRLVDSNAQLHRLSATPSVASSRDATPVIPEPDIFSTLSLSNNPVLGTASSHNSFFDVLSLPIAASQLSPSQPGGAPPRSPGVDMDMDLVELICILCGFYEGLLGCVQFFRSLSSNCICTKDHVFSLLSPFLRFRDCDLSTKRMWRRQHCQRSL